MTLWRQHVFDQLLVLHLSVRPSIYTLKVKRLEYFDLVKKNSKKSLLLTKAAFI